MKYYTKKEVAEMFSVEVDTVSSWVYKGMIGCDHDKSGRCIFSQEHIDNKKKGMKPAKQTICAHYRLLESNYNTLKEFANQKGISMNRAMNMLIEKGLVKVKKK